MTEPDDIKTPPQPTKSISRPASSGTTGKLVEANSRASEALLALTREIGDVSKEVATLRTEITAQMTAHIDKVASSLLTTHKLIREQNQSCATSGQLTLDAIKESSSRSAERESATLDTLSEMKALALQSEERETRREAREEEDRQRRLAREDQDREFELEQRKLKAGEMAQLRAKLIWAAGAIITAIVGLIVAYLAIK